MHSVVAWQLRPAIYYMATHRHQGAAQALVPAAGPWPGDFPH